MEPEVDPRRCGQGCDDDDDDEPPKPRIDFDYTLDAKSLSKLPFDVLFGRMRKKTIRRDSPPGEDMAGIDKVLLTVQNQDVTLQEFVGLISPYTADNGTVLRSVMNDDLMSFKKLAKRVFETITQDNSDVLLNQQLEIANYYKEKKAMLNEKMMQAIETIYDMAPDFDFEKYYRDKEKYLEELFPIPEDDTNEPEEMEMLKRQQAYHRLQWLRSEGERLNEENENLKMRLAQIKAQQAETQRKANESEREAEAERLRLEEEEADKRRQLEDLNEDLEKSLISKEIGMRKAQDADILKPKPKKEEDKKPDKKKERRKRQGQEWKQITAKSIDEKTICSSICEDKSRTF